MELYNTAYILTKGNFSAEKLANANIFAHIGRKNLHNVCANLYDKKSFITYFDLHWTRIGNTCETL